MLYIQAVITIVTKIISIVTWLKRGKPFNIRQEKTLRKGFERLLVIL